MIDKLDIGYDDDIEVYAYQATSKLEAKLNEVIDYLNYPTETIRPHFDKANYLKLAPQIKKIFKDENPN